GAQFHDRYERPTSSSWWQKESLVASDVMTTRPRTVAPDAKLRDIAEIMRSEDVGAVPVVEADGRLTGMVTDRDIVVRALAGDRSIDDWVARDVASTDLDVAASDDPLSRIIELMGRERIRRVPVVDANDHLVGIVSLADVAQHADHHEDLQHALRRISARRSFWSRIWR
ncbi:MAG TPA: CBS domain-containing protein, partial [Polyangia bacterium]